MNYYLEVLKKYAVLSGRASRKEYWTFTLINFTVAAATGAMSAKLLTDTYANIASGNSPEMGLLWGGGLVLILLAIYFLAMIIPSICVLVRRLHDTNRSGAWVFLFYGVWILSRFFDQGSGLFLPFCFVFIVILIIFLLFTLSDSQSDSNKYGPNPKELPKPAV